MKRGRDIHQVFCPEDLIKYHQNMDGVDRIDQLRDQGAVLSSKPHFKKWYKCGNLGLCDFGILNSHTAFNMSCERMVVHVV